jgi:hypothetical protein
MYESASNLEMYSKLPDLKQEGHDGPEVAHLYIAPPGAGPV